MEKKTKNRLPRLKETYRVQVMITGGKSWKRQKSSWERTVGQTFQGD